MVVRLSIGSVSKAAVGRKSGRSEKKSVSAEVPGSSVAESEVDGWEVAYDSVLESVMLDKRGEVPVP